MTILDSVSISEHQQLPRKWLSESIVYWGGRLSWTAHLETFVQIGRLPDSTVATGIGSFTCDSILSFRKTHSFGFGFFCCPRTRGSGRMRRTGVHWLRKICSFLPSSVGGGERIQFGSLGSTSRSRRVVARLPSLRILSDLSSNMLFQGIASRTLPEAWRRSIQRRV